ncbi:MAG: hypothetical protein KUG62_11305 [Rhodobacteraceae bacterium]|nr:hypothetical protein [Paracoccaceae bacterium]
MKKFFVTAALVAVISTPAQAGTSQNGLQLNGLQLNGFTLNGLSSNIITVNALTFNNRRETLDPAPSVLGLFLTSLAADPLNKN